MRCGRAAALALLTAAALALSACGRGYPGDPPDPAGRPDPPGGHSSPQHSPISIGYEVPLTGTVALAGKQEQEGWNLGLTVFGHRVHGHPIVTHFADTGGNPAVALSDAVSLVQQQHVQIMEGPLLANEDAAVAPYLGIERVPLDN